MNSSVLLIVVLGAAVILAVLLYNIYQENKYKEEIRKQFGHANKDALTESTANQVRDAEGSALRLHQNKKQDAVIKNTIDEQLAVNVENKIIEVTEEFIDTPLPNEEFFDKDILIEEEVSTVNNFEFSEVILQAEAKSQDKRKLLLDLNDLSQLELPWFNHCFDYMAYISLVETQELKNLPRLSNKHRYRIAGCAMDGRFQLAEPIPSVYYQGFVIGLQSISRSGLVTISEIDYFCEQVNEFAQQINGTVSFADINEFMQVARPLDELCARVDQIIAIHLVSREQINGLELRTTLETAQFELSHDGAFYYPNIHDAMFRIVTLDEMPFTPALLATQNFKGFSMLFDITKVPPGEKNFNKFMDIAVKFSSSLGLDLVDDKLEELSTTWLRNIGAYVLERQEEMEAVDIIPGQELAARIFA